MRYFLSALLICVPLSASASEQKKADSAQPVIVTNTPSVNVSTLPPVSVSTLPPVTVSVLPPVAVSSLPPVTISSLPAVQLAPGTQVQVAQPAQTPFQIGLHIHIDGNGSAGFEAFTVPAGKRAVIEYAAASGIAGGTPQLYLSANTAQTFGNGTTYMGLPLQAGPFGLTGSQLMKAYADAQTQIGCLLYVTAGPADLNCVINGYFLDVP